MQIYTAQDKADILREAWNKSCLFTEGDLNTLGWKIPYPYGGTEEEFVEIMEEHWEFLINSGCSEEEAVKLMLFGRY